MIDLIFGAAYYEEYAPEERLEQDLRLMTEAGMNTVRIAESTWSVEEPRCGEFDFSHVTRVIEAASRFGMNVIIDADLCHPQMAGGSGPGDPG